MKHSHYFKHVAHLKTLDVYRVLDLFEVTDPCIQHAVKKLLVAGGRGLKNLDKDVQEAIDSLQRWQVMQEENKVKEQQTPQGYSADPKPPQPRQPLPTRESYQKRVRRWAVDCFGEDIANDTIERCDRFIEESLELVQAVGYSKSRAIELVHYVFDRPAGAVSQEIGGVMTTLATLASAPSIDLNIEEVAETELTRISQPTMMAKIRKKRAGKPTGSALPSATKRLAPDLDQLFAQSERDQVPYPGDE